MKSIEVKLQTLAVKEKFASSKADNKILDKHMQSLVMKNVTSDNDLSQDILNKYQPAGKRISWPDAHNKLLKMGYKHTNNSSFDHSLMSKKDLKEHGKVGDFISMYSHPNFGKKFRLNVRHNQNGVKEAYNEINK